MDLITTSLEPYFHSVFPTQFVKGIFIFQLGHLTVLTGYRMLPRKDLVAVRYYFLDAACAVIAYYIHQATSSPS